MAIRSLVFVVVGAEMGHDHRYFFVGVSSFWSSSCDGVAQFTSRMPICDHLSFASLVREDTMRLVAYARAVTTQEQAAKLGVFLGGTFGTDEQKKPVGCLDMIDLDTGALDRIVIGFLGHGVTVNPRNPSCVAVFEKRGSGAALVDLRAKRRLGLIVPSAGRHFYGHGAYVNGGAELLSIESDLTTKKGVIVVRDGTSFETLAEFPSYGQSPHDCVLVDDGKTLVVTNGGGDIGSTEAPSVAYVDVASEKLKEKVTFGDPKINAGHVAIRENGDLVVCSAPRDGLGEGSIGGVTLRRGKRKPERMRTPKALVDGLVGESLSACVRGSIAGVTTPSANKVTFWDLDRQKLVGLLDLASARGIAVSADDRYWVVSHGSRPTVSLFDIDTFEPAPLPVPELSVTLSGSHIFPYAHATARSK